MPTSFCETCGQDFHTKARLSKHKERKTPCKKPVQLLQTTVTQAFVDAGLPHLEPTSEPFRDVTKKLNETLSKEVRQAEGIFFTPKKVRDLLFEKLKDLGVNPTTVLEPSFGSGEFLLDAKRHFPTAKLVGVEKNETVFKAVTCPGAELTCGDFLTWKGKADCILGNPPYFVYSAGSTQKEKDAFKKTHNHIMTGRPNIYVKFLYKCLDEHLEDNGFLAFILPTSLYNSSYYQPTRNFIQKYFTIHHLQTLNNAGFYDTNQDTMLIVIQKKKLNDNFIFRSFDGTIYMSPEANELTELQKGCTTLSQLGLKAKTGTVVWNDARDKGLLATSGTLVIYSTNIVDGTLVLDNIRYIPAKTKEQKAKELADGIKKKDMGGKRQYIQGCTEPKETGPVLLVDRGYGNSLRLNCIRVDLKEFYAENHVNVIYAVKPDATKHLDRVLKSLQDERTLRFAKALMGNGSVSATELNTVIPIF